MEKGHITHIYGNDLGELLPWCSVPLSGCHANTDDDLSSSCLTGTDLGIPSKGHRRVSTTKYSKHSSIAPVGIIVFMKYGLNVGCVDEIVLLEVGRGEGAVLQSPKRGFKWAQKYVCLNKFSMSAER